MHYIRLIQSTDNKALAAIIRQTFIEFGAPKTGTVYSDPTTDTLFELFDKNNNSKCFVAEKDGKILGCCGIFPTKGLPKKYAELVKFYLTPESRNKGIGKELFQKSIDFAIDFGYTHLYIESQPSFAKAVKLYEKFNFEYIEQPLGDSGHDNCDIWMLKKL